VTAPPQENGHPDNRPSVKDSREYYLEDDECPLAILMNHPPSRGNGLINAALMLINAAAFFACYNATQLKVAKSGNYIELHFLAAST
jgi:hypothetical protein